MGKQVVVKLIRKGVAELLKSKEMADILTECGENIRVHCTDGSPCPQEYKAITKLMGTRYIAIVEPGTIHAYRSNLKHNTILKALGEVAGKDGND